MTSQAEHHVPDQLDKLILSEFPYPVAVNYQYMLEQTDWEKKHSKCILVFEIGLRALAIALMSQYLFRDSERVNDPLLNDFLERNLAGGSLGLWREIFFRTLKEPTPT